MTWYNQITWFQKKQAAQNTREALSAVDALRQQAKQRLIGAAILVAVAVVGLPFLLDSEPRPLPSDTVVEIAKTESPKTEAPKVEPTSPELTKAEAPKAKTEQSAASSSATEKPEVTSTAVPTPTPAPTPAPVPSPKATPLVPASPSAKVSAPKAPAAPLVFPTPKPSSPTTATTNSAEADRAQALLNGNPSSKSGKFLIQAGTFADVAKAKDVMEKLNKAGIKSHLESGQAKDGSARTRVRLETFNTRESADSVAKKIKHLGIKAIVIKLNP